MRKRITVFLLCLFCIAPLPIHAADDLILGGDSIGIQIDYDGVMVTGTYAFRINEKGYNPSNQLQAKDVIQEVNGVRVHSIQELFQQINTYQKEVNQIPVKILRDNNVQNVTLTTVYDASSKAYKSGLYVKDKIAGVGTMTYYDPSTQTYGALGHEIYDADVKEIAQVPSGTIYPANVESIQKAQPNAAGEKHATINYQEELGNVQVNTPIGIYGTYEKLPAHVTSLPWAKREEIKLGRAYLYTVITQDKVEAFEINITKLNAQSESNVKGIEFNVTDERLKTLTNGIVQGMSGSPIVQDGKIIGAVTHVVTSNPLNGYGVYIEWMLDKSRNL